MFQNILNCYWKEQCGEDCQECGYMSLVDGYEDDESYYRSILQENFDIYQKLSEEFD